MLLTLHALPMKRKTTPQCNSNTSFFPLRSALEHVVLFVLQSKTMNSQT